MRNPVLKEIILETLAEAGTIGREVFLTSYARSYRNARRIMMRGTTQSKNDTQIRQSFYNLLARLKQEGLVLPEKHGASWKLTEKGRAWLSRQSWLRMFLPTGVRDCQKIVVFDIPESAKAKRQWLRNNLALFGFTMLQRSVWIGDQQLPEQFIAQIHRLGLDKHVHIFAVAKRGTLA